jgi:hypothetical protein
MEQKEKIKENELIYVCSPLRAPTWEAMQRNKEKAAEYARFLKEKFHCRAIAPHAILPDYLDDNNPQERQVAVEFDLSLVKIAKALVVCGNQISSGMKAEITLAKECGTPIHCLIEEPDGWKIKQFADTPFVK